MANMVTSARYGHMPFGRSTTLDQVDNSTNTSNRLKLFVNRMNDKYQREDERLKTFENWPLSWLDKHALAQTGMFYTNEEDKVKCYFCEVEIGRWERDDLPVPEHLRWSPNCPLLRRRTTNNLPLNADALDRILPPISYDICGSNDLSGLDVHENAYSEGRQAVQSTGGNNTAQQSVVESEPVASVNGGNYFPEYPEYAIESARLRSFEDWPRHMKQKPHQLAEAGFFYTGVGDRVRCFSCGGGLKDWDEKDEPWEQHALWLSQCRFVKLIKGQLFIDTVAAAAQDAKPAESAEPAADEKPESSSPVLGFSVDTMSRASVSSLHSAVAPAAAPTAVAAVDEAPTAAGRIYNKIVAQGCPESALGNGVGSTVPEEKLCKICYAAEYNTAFLPCGHVVACAKCASSVTKCPLCRKPFADVMRVYFS